MGGGGTGDGGLFSAFEGGRAGWDVERGALFGVGEGDLGGERGGGCGGMVRGGSHYRVRWGSVRRCQ